MKLIFALEELLWTGPLLFALLGTHIYFTGKLRFVQKHTLRGIRLSFSGPEDGVSAFGALSTSLAAAMGTGNIVGMATAVALGGPGAILWCWVTGILGMATRYAETYMVLKHRREKGRGGAMYVLEEMGKKKLARLFSLLGMLAAVGTGAMIQSNAAGTSLQDVGLPLLLCGVMLTALAGGVLFGGVKKIASVCEKLVPAMGATYLIGCGILLYVNRNAVLDGMALILQGAFLPSAAAGGFVGSSLKRALSYGTARGLFTNESGMGTAPMAAAAGPCRSVETEALVSMTGVFWDTVVVCGITGLTLVSAMAASPALFAGAGVGQLCARAFSVIPGGGLLLTVCLVIFAFATIVGWSWYGECCAAYFLGPKAVAAYRIVYLSAVFCGVFLETEVIWSLGGILAGLMALPNVYCLMRLRKEIRPPDAATP